MLPAWCYDYERALRATNSPLHVEIMQTPWAYVTLTLFATATSVGHALAYHQHVQVDASRSPPLYDPLLNGDTCFHRYHIHIQPFIRYGGQWSANKRRATEAPAPPSPVPLREAITHGVTLDFESSPSMQVFDNTFTVYQHEAEVRARISEYMAFGAVVQLPPDNHCPFGVQPLRAIIKPPKRPRLVIDLPQSRRQPLLSVLLLLLGTHRH